MVDRVFWLLAYFLVNLLFDVRIRRTSNKPIPPQAIFIANHVSSLDWLIIKAYLNTKLSFIAYHTFVELPFWGKFLRLVQCIPIGPSHSVLKRSFKLTRFHLQNGRSICIFPEGQLTKDGKMMPFQRGITKIIQEHQHIPIVPLTLCGLWDTYWSLKGGWFWEKPLKLQRPVIELVIGEPVSVPLYKFVEQKQTFLYYLVKKHYW